jgi:deoxycytidylate deaminase
MQRFNWQSYTHIILIALSVSICNSSAPDSTHQPITNQMASDRLRDLIIAESKGYDPHSPSKILKRSDYLSWDDYFLAVAYLSGKRSKHPTNSKGACIVDSQGRIVGIGYDGFPRGCSDDCLPWASKDDVNDVGDAMEESLPFLHTREPYLCHAEINAILNKCSNDVVGGRMFVPDFPCE